jgi:hypothetical protein
MSGPIVRKYGFPNFEKIFGERPLEHGVDESRPTSSSNPAAESTSDTGTSTGTNPSPKADDRSNQKA